LPARAEGNVPDWAHDSKANFSALLTAQSLQGLAEDPNFAGIAITDAGLEVSVTAGPTASQARLVTSVRSSEFSTLSKIPGLPVSVPISFTTVKNSASELKALTDTLNSDSGAWAAKGVELSSWGPDNTTNTVVVHLVNYSTVTADELTAAYGASLTVANESEAAAGSDRLADVAPWDGGDKITNSSGSCTSWFGLNGNLAATAGHCGAGVWQQSLKTYGTVSSQKFSGGVDAEIIPVSLTSGRVWSDPTSGGRAVTGVASVDPAGGLVCTNGYVDREVCSVKIVGTYQSVNYGGQLITGLTAANQTSGRSAFTPGDSGGPVEATSGSTATIAQGMIAAHNTTTYSKGWYLPAKAVTNYFGVSIKLG